MLAYNFVSVFFVNSSILTACKIIFNLMQFIDHSLVINAMFLFLLSENDSTKYDSIKYCI